MKKERQTAQVSVITETTKKNSALFVLLFSGTVAAFGPFVTDFYLPALPQLGEYFSASASLSQLTITLALAGLAVGQLIIGPLSDRYGRRPLLLISLTCFVLSTVGCLNSSNISLFLVYRFIQGLSGAGGVVISRSIATDMYDGHELAKFFAMLSGIQGIAPILAPVLGGMMLSFTDWKGIFWALFAIGFVLLLGAINFKETHTSVGGSNLTKAFKAYSPVMQNSSFRRNVLVQALSMGAMFTYIASSPFIFQQHYGLSPLAYSICFAINGFGIMVGSLLALRFKSSLGALRFGTTSLMLMSLITTVVLITAPSVYIVESAFCLLLFSVGLILPSSTTLAMEPVKANSGNGSAILGFATFLMGGICSPLAGLGNMMFSTSIIIVICAMLAFGVSCMRLTDD